MNKKIKQKINKNLVKTEEIISMSPKNKKIVTLSSLALVSATTALSVVLPLKLKKNSNGENYLDLDSTIDREIFNAIESGNYLNRAKKITQDIVKENTKNTENFVIDNDQISYKKDGTVTVFSTTGNPSSQNSSVSDQIISSVIEFKTLKDLKKVYVNSIKINFSDGMPSINLKADNIADLQNIIYKDKDENELNGKLKDVMVKTGIENTDENNQNTFIYNVNDVIINQRLIQAVNKDKIIEAIMKMHKIDKKEDFPIDLVKSYERVNYLEIDNNKFIVSINKLIPDYLKGKITFDYKVNLENKGTREKTESEVIVEHLQAQQTNQQIADGIASALGKLSIVSDKTLNPVTTPTSLTEKTLKSIGTLKGVYPPHINSSNIIYTTLGVKFPTNTKSAKGNIDISISVQDPKAYNPSISGVATATIPVEIINKDIEIVAKIEKLIKTYQPKTDIKKQINQVRSGTIFDQNVVSKYFKNAKLPIFNAPTTISYSVPTIAIGAKDKMTIVISRGTVSRDVDFQFQPVAKTMQEKATDATSYLNGVDINSLKSLGDNSVKVANAKLPMIESKLDTIFRPQDGVKPIYSTNKKDDDPKRGIIGLTVTYKYGSTNKAAKNFLVGGYGTGIPINPMQKIVNDITENDINNAIGVSQEDADIYNFPSSVSISKPGSTEDIIVSLTKVKADHFAGTISYKYSADIPFIFPPIIPNTGKGLLSGFNVNLTDAQKKAQANQFLNTITLSEIQNKEKMKPSNEVDTDGDLIVHINDTFTILNKVKPTFVIKSFDDVAGTLNVAISYAYGNQVATKDFVLPGYLTKDESDKNDVDGILTSTIEDEIRKEKPFTSSKDVKNYGNLPNIKPINGVNISLTIEDINDLAGNIRYKYSATKGKARKDGSGYLRGFKTNLTEDQKYQADKRLLNSIFGLKLNLTGNGIEDINPVDIKFDKLPEEILQLFKGLYGKYNFIKSSTGDGTINLKVMDVVGNKAPIVKPYTFSGFKTNDKILQEAKMEAIKIIKDISIPLADPAKHSQIKFNEIAQTKALVLGRIKIVQQVQNIKSIASSKTSGSGVQKILDAISKYKNSTGTDKIAVDDAIKKIIPSKIRIDDKNGLAETKPGTEFTVQIAKEFGLSYNPKGVKTTFSHPAVSTDGRLIVSFEVSKGSAKVSKDIIFTVEGIKEAKDKFVSDQIQNNIHSIKNLINGNVGYLTSNNVSGVNPVLEGTVYDSNVASSFGWFLPTIPGIKVTYGHKGIDKDGDLIIKFKINAPKAKEETATATVKVTGIYQAILNSLKTSDIRNAIGPVSGNAIDFKLNNNINISTNSVIVSTLQGEKIIVTLKKDKVDNFTGKFYYTYSADITSSPTILVPKTGSDYLFGFNQNKTDAEKKAIAQGYLDNIGSVLPPISNQSSKKASLANVKDYQFVAHLNQFKDKEGVKPTFKIDSYDDTGRLFVKVSYVYRTGAKAEIAEKIFNFDGYQTKTQSDKNDISMINADDIIKAIKAKKPYTNQENAKDYGTMPTLDPINGVNIKLTAAYIRNYPGVIGVLIDFTKGQASLQAVRSLTGFKVNLTPQQKSDKNKAFLDGDGSALDINKFLVLSGPEAVGIDPTLITDSKTPTAEQKPIPVELIKLFERLYGTNEFSLVGTGDGSIDVKVINTVVDENDPNNKISIDHQYTFTGFKNIADILIDKKIETKNELDYFIKIKKPNLEANKHDETKYDDIDKAIKDAKDAIDAATSPQSIETLVKVIDVNTKNPLLNGTEGQKIIDAISAYNNSTGTDKVSVNSALAAFKDANITINDRKGLTAIPVGTRLDQSAATRLGLGKLPIDVNVTYYHSGTLKNDQVILHLTATKDSATMSKNVILTIDGIDEAIIANAQNIAQKAVRSINIPVLDSKLHSKIEYDKISDAKKSVINDIQNSSDPAAIFAIALLNASTLPEGTGIDKIKAAIENYKLSTGTAKMLADAKIKAIAFIKNVFAQVQRDDAKHDSNIYATLFNQKDLSIKTINNVKNPSDAVALASSLTNGSEIIKMNLLIDKYNNSTGKNQVLNDAKNDAKNIIDSIKIPTQNDALYDALKFANISKVKKTAKDKIDAAKNLQEISALISSKTAGTLPHKIYNAINLYLASTGTDKSSVDSALAAFKDGTATIPNKNGLPDVSIGTILDQQTATRLGLGTLPTGVQTIKYGHESISLDGSLEVKITAHQGSVTLSKIISLLITGIDNAKFMDNKVKAQSFINKLFGQVHQDDLVHDISLFKAIESVKTKVFSDINNAKNSLEVLSIASSETKGTGIDKMKAAIAAYKSSTGSSEILANAKKVAIEIITKIPVPAINTAEHNQTKFNEIASTKREAIKDVNKSITPNAILLLVKSKTQGTSIDKIKNAISSYNLSTGTNMDDVNKTLMSFNDKAVLVNDKDGLPNVATPKLFTTNLIQELKIGTTRYGVKVTYTHPAITSDGDMKLYLIATKGSAIQTKEVTLAITGIDAAKEKALKAQAQQKIESVKKELDKMMGSISVNDKLGIPSLLAETTYTPAIANGYASQYPKTTGVTITYTHPAITKDGNLKLTFKINAPKGIEETATGTVAVTGISQAILNSLTTAEIEQAIGTVSGDAKDYQFGHVNITKQPLGVIQVALTKGIFDNYAGTINYSYEATVQGATSIGSKKGTGILKGFNTNLTDAQKKTAAQAFLDAITIPLPNITGYEDKRASSIATKIATDKNIVTYLENIFTRQNGVKELSKLVNHDEDAGKITVKISYKYGNEIASKDFTFAGFQTQDQRDYKDSHDIHSKDIVAAIQLKNPYGNNIEAKDYVIPPIDTINGVTITTKVIPSDVDNYAGKIHFTYTTSKGKSIKHSFGDLWGFKTTLTDKQKIDLNKISLDNIKSPYPLSGNGVDGVDPSILVVTKTPPSGKQTLPDKLTKLFRSLFGTHTFTLINSGDGSVDVKVTNTVGSETPIDKTYTFTGFKSIADILKDAKKKTILDIDYVLTHIKPILNPEKFDQTKFDDINKVIKAVKDAVNQAPNLIDLKKLIVLGKDTFGMVDLEGTEAHKIYDAIADYTSSKGTDKTNVDAAIARFKDTTVTINNIHGLIKRSAGSTLTQSAATILGFGTLPTNLDSITYEHPKVAANGTINVKITVKKGIETANKTIQVTITGIDETILATAKAKATQFVNNILIPTQDDAAHDALIYPRIAVAKTKVLSDISSSTDPKVVEGIASSTIAGTGIATINAVINAYNSSTGTAKILADTKTAAIGYVNDIFTAVTKDDAAHDATLYFELEDLKTATIDMINATNNKADVDKLASSKTTGSEILKMIDSVNKYNSSTGTAKILADAKTAAKLIVDSIPSPTQNDALHDASLFGLIATTKNAAKIAIDKATTPTKVTSLISSKTGGIETNKIIQSINAYNSSTGTDVSDVASALATFSDSNAVVNDKQGLAAIASGTTFTQPIATNLGLGTLPTSVDSIKYEHAEIKADGDLVVIITANKGSKTDSKTIHVTVSGINTAILVEAKTNATQFINSVSLPPQDDAAHDASIYPQIADAKNSALNDISAATDPKIVEGIASSTTTGTGIAAIKAKISKYNSSTGTAKKLTDHKKSIKLMIDSIQLPAKSSSTNDAVLTKLYSDIVSAITAAKTAVDGAGNIPDVDKLATSKTVGTEIVKINNKITIYNDTLKFKDAIQALKKDAIPTIDANKMPSQITKTDVKAAILKLGSINSLTQSQKDLLLEGDISLVPKDTMGVLEIMVKNHGADKAFTVKGFKIDYDLYNTTPKVIVADDDNTGNKYVDLVTNNVVVYKKFTDTHPADLLKGIHSNGKIAYKVTIDWYNKYISGSNSTWANVKKEASDDSKFKNVETFYVIWDSNVKDGDVVHTKWLQTNNVKWFNAKLVWKKQANNKFSLMIVYEDIRNERGDDDSFYKFTASPISAADALSKVQSKAKAFVTAVANKAPKTNSETTSQNIFDNIAKKVDDANKAIDGATDISTISKIASSETVGTGITGIIEATKKYNDSIILKDAIQALKKDAIPTIDANKMPSQITKTDVKAAILKLGSINSLTQSQKNLLVEGDISLVSNDVTGILEIMVKNHGADKAFTVKGFKINSNLYNTTPKVIGSNDDNYTDNNVEFATDQLLVFNKYTANDQIELLKEVTSSKSIGYKIIIDKMDSNDSFMDPSYSINNLKSKAADKSKFKDPENIYVIWSPSVKDGDIAAQKLIKDRTNGTIDVKFKWKKVNNKFSLMIFYENRSNPWGDNDSIFRYTASTTTAADALTKTKNAAKAFAATVRAKAPATLPANTIKAPFDNMTTVFKAANKAIDDATDIYAINKLASSDSKGTEIVKIIDAVNIFKESIAFNDALQALSKTAIPDFDATKIANRITRQDIINAILNLNSINNLKQSQKDLLVEDDIYIIADYTEGTLLAIVKNHGNDKEFLTKGLKINQRDYNFMPKVVALDDDNYFGHYIEKNDNQLVIFNKFEEENVIDLLKGINPNKPTLYKFAIDLMKGADSYIKEGLGWKNLKARIADERKFRDPEEVFVSWDANTKDGDVAFTKNFTAYNNRSFKVEFIWKKVNGKFNLLLHYTTPYNGGGDEDSIIRYTLSGFYDYNNIQKVVASNDDVSTDKSLSSADDKLFVYKKWSENNIIELLKGIKPGAETYYKVHIEEMQGKDTILNGAFSMEDLKERASHEIKFSKNTNVSVKWSSSTKDGDIAGQTKLKSNAGRDIDIKLIWKKVNNTFSLMLYYETQTGGSGDDDSIIKYSVTEDVNPHNIDLTMVEIRVDPVERYLLKGVSSKGKIYYKIHMTSWDNIPESWSHGLKVWGLTGDAFDRNFTNKKDIYITWDPNTKDGDVAFTKQSINGNSVELKLVWEKVANNGFALKMVYPGFTKSAYWSLYKFKPSKPLPWNDIPKVVVTNDDNRNSTTPVWKNGHLILRQKFSKSNVVQLLKDVNSTKEIWYKATIDQMDNNDNSLGYDISIDDLSTKSAIPGIFKKPKDIYIKWSPSVKDGDVAYIGKAKDHVGVPIDFKFIWQKTGGDKFDLWLYYNDLTNGSGDNDSLIRYRIKPAKDGYNYIPKVIVANEMNKTNKYNQIIDGKIVIYKKYRDNDVIPLLKDIESKVNVLYKLRMDSLLIKLVGPTSPWSYVKTQVSDDTRFTNPKDIYVIWTPNTKDGDIAYKTQLKSENGAKFTLKLVWKKQANNKFSLMIVYDDILQWSKGEDDSFYRFRVLPITDKDTYNYMPKVVVANDDNVATEYNQVVDGKIVVYKKFTDNDVIPLLEDIDSKEQALYKIRLDSSLMKLYNLSSTTWSWLTTQVSDNRFVDPIYFYVLWNSNVKDGDVAYSSIQSEYNQTGFKLKLVWKKQANNKFSLMIVYDGIKNDAGEDDSLYRFTVYKPDKSWTDIEKRIIRDDGNKQRYEDLLYNDEYVIYENSSNIYGTELMKGIKPKKKQDFKVTISTSNNKYLFYGKSGSQASTWSNVKAFTKWASVYHDPKEVYISWTPNTQDGDIAYKEIYDGLMFQKWEIRLVWKKQADGTFSLVYELGNWKDDDITSDDMFIKFKIEPKGLSVADQNKASTIKEIYGD